MLARLFLLFIVVPVADLMLLLWLARWLTFWPTVALIVTTASLGAWLTRQQLRQLRRRVSQPVTEIQAVGPLFGDTIMILLAGALLITPGLITDAVGFTLMIPRVRRWLQIRWAAWFLSKFKFQVLTPFSRADRGTVDGSVNHPAADDDEVERDSLGPAVRPQLVKPLRVTQEPKLDPPVP